MAVACWEPDKPVGRLSALLSAKIAFVWTTCQNKATGWSKIVLGVSIGKRAILNAKIAGRKLNLCKNQRLKNVLENMKKKERKNAKFNVPVCPCRKHVEGKNCIF